MRPRHEASEIDEPMRLYQRGKRGFNEAEARGLGNRVELLVRPARGLASMRPRHEASEIMESAVAVAKDKAALQ